MCVQTIPPGPMRKNNTPARGSFRCLNCMWVPAIAVRFDTFTKPKWCFRTEANGGPVPDKVTLMLHPHPLAAQDPEGFVRAVKKGVKEVVEAKRKAVKRHGRFRGRAAILTQHWNSSPKTKAPRRAMNPKVADSNSTLRVLKIISNAWFQAGMPRR